MKIRSFHWTMFLGLLAALALSGCAKKQAPQPPQPPPAPPVTQKQEPEATPAPAPKEEPAPSPITSGDFQPAFFDYDSYSLREDARAALDKNAKLLRDNAGLQITIEGHCDERGTVEYNQALGERRAAAARDYLLAAGISASRVQIISFGKERPFSAGHDEASWQQNRRAHFAVRS